MAEDLVLVYAVGTTETFTDEPSLTQHPPWNGVFTLVLGSFDERVVSHAYVVAVSARVGAAREEIDQGEDRC